MLTLYFISAQYENSLYQREVCYIKHLSSFTILVLLYSAHSCIFFTTYNLFINSLFIHIFRLLPQHTSSWFNIFTLYANTSSLQNFIKFHAYLLQLLPVYMKLTCRILGQNDYLIVVKTPDNLVKVLFKNLGFMPLGEMPVPMESGAVL